MSRVAVLASTRLDPVSGRATRSTADAAALQLALTLDPQARVLTAGDMPEAVARAYLAQGAACVEGVADVAALAQAARGAGLVLAGARGEGGRGSGLVPYVVAQAIGYPLVTEVIAAQADGDGWLLTQALARGARRRLRVGGAVLAVLSAHAPAATRHSFDAAQRGRIERSSAPAAAPDAADWRLEPSRRQLRPLEARSRQSGHARMAGAIGSAPAVAGIVMQDGSVDDKARALLQHLRAHQLIDF